MVLTVASWFFPEASSRFAGDPILVCPNQFELGERELEELIELQIPIANQGTAPLRIHKISAAVTCDCAGLESVESGIRRRIESLELPPGGCLNTVARLHLRADPHKPAITSITLYSNDPSKPEYAITFRVSHVRRGIYCEPIGVEGKQVLGDLPPQHRIEVYDDLKPARTLRHLEFSRPDRIQDLKWQQATAEVHDPKRGRLLGCVTFRLRPVQPEWIEGTLFLHFERTVRPERVKICYRIVEAAEIFPNSVVLPRGKGDQQTFSALVDCRSHRPQQAEWVSADTPDGVTVQPEKSDKPDAPLRFRVSLDPEARLPDAGAIATIRLKCGNQTVTQELKVLRLKE